MSLINIILESDYILQLTNIIIYNFSKFLKIIYEYIFDIQSTIQFMKYLS